MYKTPEDLYLQIKNSNLGHVDSHKKIAYGIQFYIDNNIVRIYSSKKKGITLDTSQCKNEDLILELNKIYNNKKGNLKDSPDFNYDNLYPIMEPPLLGSDEVGKGDYFTPIIVGSAYLTKNEYDILKTLGVKDSKALNDKQIKKLAIEIKKVTSNYSILKIGQKKYNELYKKVGNINAFLAWAHITNIKNTYKKEPFKRALIDKFGREEQIKSGLKDLNLELVFRPKAEQNIAVAAASILARDALLSVIENMNTHYNFDFPLGASNLVIQKGKEFVSKFSEEELNNVCKLHFKTTKDILK